MASPLWLRGAASQPLFNGKDLAGWHIVDGPESAFYVEDGAICASPSSIWPAWLSTDREFENFDLRLEFFVTGWSDGGVYFAAPKYGRPSFCGYKVNIFQQVDEDPRTNSMGALFNVVAPQVVPPMRASIVVPAAAGWPFTVTLPTNREGGVGGDCAPATETTNALPMAAATAARPSCFRKRPALLCMRKPSSWP